MGNKWFAALICTAVGGILIGAIVLIMTVVNWPVYDPIGTARNMSIILGETVSPSMIAPPNYTWSIVGLIIGGLLVLIGVVAGLFAMLAGALRNRPQEPAVQPHPEAPRPPAG